MFVTFKQADNTTTPALTFSSLLTTHMYALSTAGWSQTSEVPQSHRACVASDFSQDGSCVALAYDSTVLLLDIDANFEKLHDAHQHHESVM